MRLPIRSTVLLLLALALAAPANAAGYRVLDADVSPGDPDTIQVTEFFWYGCPHCYRFAPYVEEWRSQKPEGVAFRHMPAVLSERWALHGRAFYAAKALGVLERFHMAMFEAMHEDGKRMSTEAAIGDFVAGLGIDREAFLDAMNSLGVDTRMRRARDLQQRYGVSGTPSVVVDGRYITSGSQAGSFQRMIEIINERVAAVRAERG